MNEATTRAEKIFAWIIPQEEGLPLIPVGADGTSFGRNIKRNSRYLKNICAAPQQAEIIWDKTGLHIKDLACNGFTALNGKALYGEKEEDLFHGDSIELAGESFKIYRCDKLARPRLSFHVSFECEGEVLCRAEYSKGDEIKFPYVPEIRFEENANRMFDSWRDKDGNNLGSAIGLKCTGDNKYSAIYKNYVAQGGSTLITDSIVIDKRTYEFAKIPPAGFRFGGSKQHECYFAGESGVCAEMSRDPTELKVLKAHCVQINGRFAEPGERFTPSAHDVIDICGKSFMVVDQRKKVGKEPSLRFDNGIEEPLSGLTDGKSVYIGRDHQKKALGNNFLVGRDHAIIRKENGKYFIRDNDSKNGTFVKKISTGKEERLTNGTEVMLENGDVIRLAFFDVTFVAN